MTNVSIASPEAFLSSLRQDIISGKNLTIRGVARCCGVEHASVIRDGAFGSELLTELMRRQGYKAAELIKTGFPPQAVAIAVEYFAYESKAYSPMAKQVARAFMSIGLVTVLESLVKKPAEIIPVKIEPQISESEIVKELIELRRDQRIQANRLRKQIEAVFPVKTLKEYIFVVEPLALRLMEYGFQPAGKANVKPAGKIYWFADGLTIQHVISEFYCTSNGLSLPSVDLDD